MASALDRRALLARNGDCGLLGQKEERDEEASRSENARPERCPAPKIQPATATATRNATAQTSPSTPTLRRTTQSSQTLDASSVKPSPRRSSSIQLPALGTKRALRGTSEIRQNGAASPRPTAAKTSRATPALTRWIQVLTRRTRAARADHTPAQREASTTATARPAAKPKPKLAAIFRQFGTRSLSRSEC